jgi:flagella basal body P-ring formation protein FlgA
LGTERYLRVREVQDALERHGVSLADHVFSGSSVVTIRSDTKTEPVKRESRTSASERKRAIDAVRQAVKSYLHQHASADEDWQVDVELDEEQLRSMAAAGQPVSVSGGNAPWTGKQRFTLQLNGEAGAQKLTVEAEVNAPPAVVVAVRALPRGAVIQASDVQLVRSSAPLGNAERLARLEDVLGKETTQAVAAGKPLDRQAFRDPLLVKRGEVVTVYARSSGVQVKTQARARDNGSLGELVTVESLLDRKSYLAHVSGIQEAEVYARAASARQDEPSQAIHGQAQEVQP